VNHLVPSGTATHVPSGTRSSCYRGPESPETFWRSTTCRARNFPNPESFGFFLTERALFAAEDNQRSAAYNATIGAFPNMSAGSETVLASRRAGFSAQQFSGEGEIA
jgi:hypothetical protein